MINLNSINYRKLVLRCFVAICFFLLLAPNITIFMEKRNMAIVRQENRKINPVPEFHPKNKNFYTALEKCYQDRLLYRDKLIWFWKKANFEAGVILNNNLFMGSDKWLFNKGEFVRNFTDKKAKLSKLKEIQNYCQKNNVKFLFIAPPRKNSIYIDYIPKKYSVQYPDYAVIENDMINECKKQGINYVSLYKPLLDSRKVFDRPIYLADDHHWSYEGAAVGADSVLKWIHLENTDFHYNGLMFDGTYRKASKEYSEINSLGLAIPGVTNRTLAPWSKNYTQEIYGVNNVTGKEEIKFSNDKDPVSNAYLWGKIVNGEGIIVNKDSKNKKTILVLNDSYGSYMGTYLSQFTDKMIFTHYRDKAGKKKNTNLRYLLGHYKPDIVILQISAPTFFSSKGASVFANIVM